eukprot:3675632-Heterocapsa_arctica.AAC.1
MPPPQVVEPFFAEWKSPAMMIRSCMNSARWFEKAFEAFRSWVVVHWGTSCAPMMWWEPSSVLIDM